MYSCIVKYGDDLRQDQLALQLIEQVRPLLTLSHPLFLPYSPIFLCGQFRIIFEMRKLPLPLHIYRILITTNTSGLMETVPDAHSLDR